MLERLHLPTSVVARDTTVLIRRATRDDLEAMVRLLTDDPISAGREGAGRDERAYAAGMDRITADPGNELVVAVDPAGTVIGMLQLTAIPGLARRGSTRLLVEAVRVATTQRSTGVGTALMRWVMDQAAVDLDARLVQLTSDAARVDAHRFYRRLGFVDSHVGFKLHLDQGGPPTP